MKYYSEILNKTFDTVDALNEAERAEKARLVAKSKETAARTEKIAAAKKERDTAYKAYADLLKSCDEAYAKYREAETAYRAARGWTVEKIRKVSLADLIDRLMYL